MARRKSRKVKNQVQKNQCGGCTACCIQYTLPELNKPARTPCPHLCETGCSIHSQPRFPICTEFECGYLLFEWPEELHPDNCGIIFLLEALIRVNPRNGGVTLSAFSSSADVRGRPKLWMGNCITAEVFKNPPDAVVEFIRRQVKNKGAVVLTHQDNGPLDTKVFAHKSTTITKDRFWAFHKTVHRERLRAIQRLEQQSRRDDQVMYGYRVALKLHQHPTGETALDLFVERALASLHQMFLERGLPRDSDDDTTPDPYAGYRTLEVDGQQLQHWLSPEGLQALYRLHQSPVKPSMPAGIGDFLKPFLNQPHPNLDFLCVKMLLAMARLDAQLLASAELLAPPSMSGGGTQLPDFEEQVIRIRIRVREAENPSSVLKPPVNEK